MKNSFFYQKVNSPIRFLTAFLISFLILLSNVISAQTTITGHVFNDGNNNGTKDTPEVGYPYVIVAAYAPGATTPSVTVQTNSTAPNQGDYILSGLTTGTSYRIEFINPNGYFNAAVGAQSNSSVQFATPGVTNLDFGIRVPGVCLADDNPTLVQGSSLAATGVTASLISWKYNSRTPYNVAATSMHPYNNDALPTEVGIPGALTVRKIDNKVLFSTVSSQFSSWYPMAVDGYGAIYMADYSGANDTFLNYKFLLNFDTLGFNTTNQRPAGGLTLFNSAGVSGLSGIAYDNTNEVMYVMNLGNSTIFKVNMAGVDYSALPATAPTAADVSIITIPSSLTKDGVNGYYRGGALKVLGNKLYIVGNNDASSGTTADLFCSVISMDIATGGFNLDLGFVADFIGGSGNGFDSSWVNKPWINTQFLNKLQPFLNSFDIADNGDFLLGAINRKALDGAFRSTGWMLKAAYTSTGYVLENNGVCGGVATQARTKDTTGPNASYSGPGNWDITGYAKSGPGGALFFENMLPVAYSNPSWMPHAHVYCGGMYNVSGTGEVIAGFMDPLSFARTGARWLNVESGQTTYGRNNYQSKSTSLTGMDAVCDANPIEIGNRVWRDANANGIQDGDELPVAGVTIELCDSTGATVATALTDAAGNYLFSNNSATNTTSAIYNLSLNLLKLYSLKITNLGVSPLVSGLTLTSVSPVIGESANTLNSGVTLSNSDAFIIGGQPTIPFRLGSEGQNIHNYDFGLANCAVSAGFDIILGCDGDSVQIGSAPLDGYTYSWSPTTGLTNTTSAQIMAAPAVTTDYILTATNGAGSCMDTVTVTVDTILRAIVGNYVWSDFNQDGLQDEAASFGLNGLTVELYSETAQNSGALTLEQTAVTANDGTGNPGYYQFEVCGAGWYKVKFPLANNSGEALTIGTFAPGTDSNSDASISDGFSPSFYIDKYGTPIQQVNNTIDAGYKAYAQLGNYVWNDMNQDGVQDANEVGVAGIVVSLCDTGNNIISSTVTDAFGYYLFSPLDPGDYTLKFSLTPNYVFTTQNNGNDSTDSDVNSDGVTGTYTIVPGDKNLTVDAGIHITTPTSASVGDYVWYDANNDGIQDANEVGISGIIVTLCDNLGNIVATTITDANGEYLFNDVAPGVYAVGFTPQAGLGFSPNNGGINSANNSDANPATGKTSTFTVNQGDQIRYVDAGLYKLPTTVGSLGDKVWYDVNNDGIQDINETGVAAVTVTLYQSDGTTVISTTTTDALGNYIFNDLAAGQYVVGFSNLPSGFAFSPQGAGSDTAKNSDANATTGNTGIITLGMGQHDMTHDAGIFNSTANLNSIGDYVWHDEDKDGTQDINEEGVGGITVILCDVNGNPLANTVTNADGFYLFPFLANGTYAVKFSNLPVDYVFTQVLGSLASGTNSDADPSTGKTETVSLTGNTHRTYLDAGIYSGNMNIATASLGNFVWYDWDNNNFQSPEEAGAPGLKVYLCNADGTVKLDSTVTDGQGYYLFSDLEPGTYSVGFTKPSNFTFVTKHSFNLNLNSDANTVTGKTDSVTLAAGENNMDIDAGIRANSGLASLGNFVWYDLNQDGLQDAGEPGVPGVTAKLYDDGGKFLDARATNSNGYYVFSGLPSNVSYYVGFCNLPSGFTFTTQNADNIGLNGLVNSDANPITGETLTDLLSFSEENMRFDAGIISNTVGSIGDYVWCDANEDGIQGSPLTEPGVEGILVTLYDNTNTAVASTFTNATGYYLFPNVNPGAYTIGFTNLPSSKTFTISNQGSDSTDSDVDPLTGRTGTVTVTAGTHNPTVDAGIRTVLLAGLGNYVWHDINEDGVQDTGEPAVGGVLVTLYASDGTTILAQTVTSGEGFYSFTELPAEDYSVGFSFLPNGAVPTVSSGAVNVANNSDMNTSTLKTGSVTLAGGDYNPNLDGGIYFGSPLPVGLSTITIVEENCSSILRWTTVSEENTARFDIFRSEGNSNVFEKIGEVVASGNSSVEQTYQFVDNNLDGDYIYKLRIVDFDLSTSYSRSVSLSLDCSANGLVKLYPNPVEDNLTVHSSLDQDDFYTVRLFDMVGRLVFETKREVSLGNDQFVIPMSSLASGSYLLKINGEHIGKQEFKVQKK